MVWGWWWNGVGWCEGGGGMGFWRMVVEWGFGGWWWKLLEDGGGMGFWRMVVETFGGWWWKLLEDGGGNFWKV